jgi:hypothetical protein
MDENKYSLINLIHDGWKWSMNNESN